MYLANKGNSISDVILDPTITLEDMLEIIAKEYQIKPEKIIEKGRQKELIEPRHIYCYVSWFHTRFTLDAIGISINRDHTTCINSRRTMENWLATEEEMREKVIKIVDKIADEFLKIVEQRKKDMPHRFSTITP